MQGVILFLLNFMTSLAILMLVAASLGLIFGQLGIVNLAQGDFVMVGAFVMYACRDLPFLVGIAAAALVGISTGYALEAGILRRLYDRGFLATLLATWGIGIVLRQAADALFTSTPHAVNPPVDGAVVILGVLYPTYRLVSAGAMAGLVAALLIFAYRTTFGLRLRASMDNVEMASILGIHPRRMFALTFVVGTTLAVLAGAIVSPTLGITPSLGLVYLAPAFFAVLVGRPGSIGGPVAGAVLVALLTAGAQRFFTSTVAESIVFGALVLLVAVRPGGLEWRLAVRMRRPSASRATASAG